MLGHGVVLHPFQFTAASFWGLSAPLLEEEGHSGSLAAVPDVTDPLGPHWPRLRAALTTDYDPGYPLEIDVPDGT